MCNLELYKTVIDDFGESAQCFLEEGIFIIFGENAPSELKNFCFLHSQNIWKSEIKVGDIVYIGDEKCAVSYVGEAVNKNLKEIGHITFSFKENYKTNPMPGTLYLKAKRAIKIQIGTEIKIVRR